MCMSIVLSVLMYSFPSCTVRIIAMVGMHSTLLLVLGTLKWCIKYLLPLFGEKKFKQDNDGCTCLDLARNAKRGEVVDYLLQEGGFAKHLN